MFITYERSLLFEKQLIFCMKLSTKNREWTFIYINNHSSTEFSRNLKLSTMPRNSGFMH